MLFVISPAKTLDFSVKNYPQNFSNPQFADHSEILIKELKKLSSKRLEKLMQISKKLADLNFRRYQDFIHFNQVNRQIAKPALFVYDGDVYSTINEENYDKREIDFAQNNLRILSGLYGVLRPLDLIQPYRLEMGINLKINHSKNIYDFWQKIITDYFNIELQKRGEGIIVNLASDEYSSVINPKLLKGKLLNIIFKNNKNGSYKNIGLISKKARGLMADFIIKNQIIKTENLKLFKERGYHFREEVSDDFNWHFYA